MSSHDDRLDDRLETRLRGLFGTLDARPGFETRVAARIALQDRVERRREIEHRRLAREAWSQGLTITGVGLAAGALVWRHAGDITQWAQSGGLSAALDPGQVSALSTAVLLAALWPWLRRLPVLREL